MNVVHLFLKGLAGDVRTWFIICRNYDFSNDMFVKLIDTDYLCLLMSDFVSFG